MWFYDLMYYVYVCWRIVKMCVPCVFLGYKRCFINLWVWTILFIKIINTTYAFKLDALNPIFRTITVIYTFARTNVNSFALCSAIYQSLHHVFDCEISRSPETNLHQDVELNCVTMCITVIRVEPTCTRIIVLYDTHTPSY